MKISPPKMLKQFFLLLTVTLVLPALIRATTPLEDPATFYSSSGFISSPSIYSYTIEKQIPSNQTTTTYQVFPQAFNQAFHSQQKQQAEIVPYRKLHYSNSNSKLNLNASSGNRKLVTGSSAKSGPTATATTSPVPEPRQLAPVSDCSSDRLVVYKVVLHTYWTRELFPKHYPDWRPSAQWTKTLGRTHDSTFALYHIGNQATAGVKQFAETGKTDILDTLQGEQEQQELQQQKSSKQQQQQQINTKASNKNPSRNTTIYKTNNINLNERSVFDEFNLPAITTGAGRSEAKFFVDSNHSLVSLMTRIVPSPDWFIGVDSFQLCVGGSWIDTVTVEMDPLDAGTDNGFTFTAPNWPTSPQGVIYRITSRYPAHPAGSFFYPKSKRLPPIATFQFIKLKEYELSEVFNFAEDDRKYETVQTQTHLETEPNHVEMNNELSANIERERQNEIEPQPTTVTEKDRIRSKLLEKMNPMINSSTSESSAGVPANDTQAIVEDIGKSYRNWEYLQAQPSTLTDLLHERMQRRRRMKRLRDCRVGEWSEWSDCNKECGIGEIHRHRKVVQHGKRGGRPCPPLKQSKWCFSQQGCHIPDSHSDLPAEQIQPEKPQTPE